MARGRRTQQVIQVVRRAKGGARRRATGFLKSRGKFGSGRMIDDIERSLGRGQLYGGVAKKIFPGVVPIAELYGEYSAGGLTALAINEFLVKPFIGLPSQLQNVLGSTGLNLGGLFGGGTTPGMPPQVVG